MRILDSSVVFKTLVVESNSDKAKRLIEDYRNGAEDRIAPDIFPIEVGHALTKAERQGRIQPMTDTLSGPVCEQRIVGEPSWRTF